MEYLHSVSLERDKCKGCTHCIMRCPTEAIRVREGKAKIISERCIDCGECIRICPHRAKKAVCDSFGDLNKYKYKICLPPPALYGQFNNMDDIDYILNGILKCGFDALFEVSKAAEIISDYMRMMMYMDNHNTAKPVISSSCPVITRLIAVRYPNLRDNILKILPPVELAARTARSEALRMNPHLKSEDIGIFFITPCPAKASYAKKPDCVKKSDIDGVIAMSDIYFKLVNEMKNIKKIEPLMSSGVIGISWASTGGESSALLNEKYLAADGIKNVINVLDQIEIQSESFLELDFIELNACSGGCVGGVLTVENAYIARARIQKLRKYLPLSQNYAEKNIDKAEMLWESKLHHNPALKLNEDTKTALKMMIEMENIIKNLPAIDCGACGSPSCKALAEDIVRGEAAEQDCLIKMREKLNELSV